MPPRKKKLHVEFDESALDKPMEIPPAPEPKAPKANLVKAPPPDNISDSEGENISSLDALADMLLEERLQKQREADAAHTKRTAKKALTLVEKLIEIKTKRDKELAAQEAKQEAKKKNKAKVPLVSEIAVSSPTPVTIPGTLPSVTIPITTPPPPIKPLPALPPKEISSMLVTTPLAETISQYVRRIPGRVRANNNNIRNSIDSKLHSNILIDRILSF